MGQKLFVQFDFHPVLVILLLCLMALSAYIKLYDTHRDGNWERRGGWGDNLLANRAELDLFNWEMCVNPPTYIHKQAI